MPIKRNCYLQSPYNLKYDMTMQIYVVLNCYKTCTLRSLYAFIYEKTMQIYVMFYVYKTKVYPMTPKRLQISLIDKLRVLCL